jgi:hypothetical protein
MVRGVGCEDAWLNLYEGGGCGFRRDRSGSAQQQKLPTQVWDAATIEILLQVNEIMRGG